METARDSIKYVRPVYSKTFNGNELVDKTEDFNRLYEDADELNDINREDYRRPIYESTEDRISQELATVLPTFEEGSGAVATFAFAPYADVDEAKAALEGAGVKAAEAEKKANELFKASKKWGAKGEKYLNGYATVYYGTDQNVVAIQDKRTGTFFTAPDFAGLTVDIVAQPGQVAVITVEGEVGADFNTKKYGEFDAKKLRVFGRYDSEDDFNGDYLGEVEIKMSDYFFSPRPTTIGVTWSQMSEIVLDTSFNVTAEEYLVTYASQAIKMHLDYQAVKMAYRVAKTNPASYQITFDAAYNSEKDSRLEGYVHNAETFPLAIDTVGDNMLNDINHVLSVA